MIALLQSRSLIPDPITLDTELRLCLHPLDRVYSLPIWVEEHTGRDAEKAARKWTTVGDVMEWMEGS